MRRLLKAVSARFGDPFRLVYKKQREEKINRCNPLVCPRKH